MFLIFVIAEQLSCLIMGVILVAYRMIVSILEFVFSAWPWRLPPGEGWGDGWGRPPMGIEREGVGPDMTKYRLSHRVQLETACCRKAWGDGVGPYLRIHRHTHMHIYIYIIIYREMEREILSVIMMIPPVTTSDKRNPPARAGPP